DLVTGVQTCALPICDAQSLRGNKRTGYVEGHHRVFEAPAFGSAQQFRSGHAAVSKVRLIHRDATYSHQVFALAKLKPRRLALHYECGHSSSASLGIYSRKDGVDACSRAIGRPLLVTVDHVGVAVAFRVRLQTACVRTRGLFRKAEGDQLLAGSDVGQVLHLLLFGSSQDDRKRAEGVDDIGATNAPALARYLLDYNAQVEQAGACSAVVPRYPHAHHSLFFKSIDHAPGILARAVELGGDGLDVTVGDAS